MSYTLYENATESENRTPFFLDVQNELCKAFATRIVIPVTWIAPPPVHLDVVIRDELKRVPIYCHVPQLAAVRLEHLGKPITTLSHREYDIRRAIDRMFGGW
jgi:toxin CcdB